MFEKITAKLAVFALRHKKLSGEQKAFVTSALLDNLTTFPIRDIISIDQAGNLTVKGTKLDAEQKVSFRESGAALKASIARKLIHDQMIYKAINIGVHNGQSPDQITFSKAALWVIQEEDALIDMFTGELSTFD